MFNVSNVVNTTTNIIGTGARLTAVPTTIILQDRFDGISGNITGSTRIATPGPGIWNTVGTGSQLQIIGGGELLINGGNKGLVTASGLTKASGLAIMATIKIKRDSYLARLGFGSASDLFSDVADLYIHNSNNKIVHTTNATGVTMFAGVLTPGESYRFAVDYEVETVRYWAQGGDFNLHGAIIGTNRWFPLGEMPFTPPTNMYGVLRTDTASSVTFSDAKIVSNFSPDTSSQNIAFSSTFGALHVPSLQVDSQGRRWVNWSHGEGEGLVTILNTDVRVRVRLANGTWGPVFIVAPVPTFDGLTGVIGGGLLVVNGQMWCIYHKTTTDWGGATPLVGSNSVYKYKILSADTNGVITAGSEQALNIPNLASLDYFQGAGITTSTGRLLLPLEKIKSGSLPWYSYIAYSDDNGSTWSTATIAAPAESVQYYEPSVVKEVDGTLACYMRSGTLVYRSVSTNNGTTWSQAVKTSIPCPDSRVMVRRMDDGRTLLIGNDSGASVQGRRRLSAWILGAGGIPEFKMLLGDYNDNAGWGDYAGPQLRYPDAILDGNTIQFVWSQTWGTGSSIIWQERDFLLSPQSIDNGGTGQKNLLDTAINCGLTLRNKRVSISEPWEFIKGLDATNAGITASTITLAGKVFTLNGTFTLIAGSATVSDTNVTANSTILITLKTLGGTRSGNPDIVPAASTGFTATGAATDTSTYNYVIIN